MIIIFITMEFIKNRMAIHRYYHDGQLRIRAELLCLRSTIQEEQSNNGWPRGSYRFFWTTSNTQQLFTEKDKRCDVFLRREVP